MTDKATFYRENSFFLQFFDIKVNLDISRINNQVSNMGLLFAGNS